MRFLATIFILALSLTCSAQLTEITSFGSNPGNLRSYFYAPSSSNNNPKPLVVVLHGCTQSANEISSNTGWNKLADLHDFILLYPEQKSINNFSSCFNWFNQMDNERDQGEALSIKQQIDHIKTMFNISNDKIYVTGFSAGGAMTNIMLASYPDIFAKGGVLAGIPYKASTSSFTITTAMNPGINNTPSQWKSKVTSNFPYSGEYPKVAIVHGGLDFTVGFMNATETMEQWTAIHNIDAIADYTTSSFKNNPEIKQQIHLSNSDTIVMMYLIDQMGHSVPVNPGNTDLEGGQIDTYAADFNFHSTYWIADFFNLIPSTITSSINKEEDLTTVYQKGDALYIENLKERTTLTMFSIDGKVLLQQKVNSSTTIPLNEISNFQTVILKLRNKKSTQTRQLIISKN